VTGPDPLPPPPRAELPLPPALARLGSRHPLVIAAVIVTVAVTVATTVVTIAGFLADRWWVFDIVTSFRPQAIIVLLVAVVALAILRIWWILPVAILSLALNATQVAPVYTHHQPLTAVNSPTLTIAHLNLQSNRGDLPGIINWLGGRPADIVVILDTKFDLANAVHDGVNGYRMIYPRMKTIVPSTTTTPSATPTTVPGRKNKNQASRTGNTLTFEPRGAEVVVLTDRDGVTADAPSIVGLPESVVELHATIGDQPVALLGLHTQPPTTLLNHDRRNRQLDAVTTWLANAPQPAIAFGDFNVTYYSPYLRRLLHRSGASSSQLGFGVQASWPIQFRLAGIGIDQSVYTGNVTPIARQRGPSFGSEHRSLIVTYALAAP
jgi:endonuclease/exonuclease/phosphatase (EEP) superfamily protein YafD